MCTVRLNPFLFCGILVAAMTHFSSSIAADQITSHESILNLAKAYFKGQEDDQGNPLEPFTQAERDLFIAAQTGDPVHGEGYLEHPLSQALLNGAPLKINDPRVIRGEILTWLSHPNSSEENKLRTVYGFHLYGVEIHDAIILGNADSDFSFYAFGCVFTDSIRAEGSHLKSFRLLHCHTASIYFSEAKVDGPFTFSNSQLANGRISLARADIAGNLSFEGSRLNDFVGPPAPADPDAPDQPPLDATAAKIHGNCYLHNFHVNGSVVFKYAMIDGDVDFDNAKITSFSDWAVDAYAAKVGGNVFCTPLSNAEKFADDLQNKNSDSSGSSSEEVSFFKVVGGMRMSNAAINGSFFCKDAELSAGATALEARNISVNGDMRIDGDMICGAVDLSYAKILGTLLWSRIRDHSNFSLSLNAAKVSVLDDQGSSWPKQGALNLNGLTYDHLDGDTGLEAKDAPAPSLPALNNRLEWIRRQEPPPWLRTPDRFSFSSYEQLADFYRKENRDEDAKAVEKAKNSDYASYLKPYFSLQWWWYGVVGWYIGYGYEPGWVFFNSLLFIAIGALLFRVGYEYRLIGPKKDELCPPFNALVYSFETFTPILHLDQADNWGPTPNGKATITLKSVHLPVSSRLFQYYLWFHIMFGFVLTTLWIGGLTGLVKT